MNKYQEAFDFIVTATNGGNGIKKELKALQELVDKATSKKPLGISLTHDGRVGNCPCCNKLIRENDSKPNICECGQRLDWSD